MLPYPFFFLFCFNFSNFHTESLKWVQVSGGLQRQHVSLLNKGCRYFTGKCAMFLSSTPSSRFLTAHGSRRTSAAWYKTWTWLSFLQGQSFFVPIGKHLASGESLPIPALFLLHTYVSLSKSQTCLLHLLETLTQRGVLLVPGTHRFTPRTGSNTAYSWLRFSASFKIEKN